MDTRASRNIDPDTVDSFGREWARFDQSELTSDELAKLFSTYFSIFPWNRLPPGAVGFDMGCGSGRWARLVAPRVGRLHCVDPASDALCVAARTLAGCNNIEFLHASVDSVPLASESQDFGYSLGVLHHIPDTAAALKACTSLLKPGAPFLLYLYYRFDNRPVWFRGVWHASDLLRRGISRLPDTMKSAATDMLAAILYWPLARLAGLAEKLGLNPAPLPLSFYRNASFYTMRTDSRDRFGTPLEQRFTRPEIEAMMGAAGLTDIRFSEREPYWVAVGIKERSARQRMPVGTHPEERERVHDSALLARSRRMLVLCPFPEGVAAGQRLKYEQYFDDWRARGWQIDVSPFMDLPTWNVAYERGHLSAKVFGVLRGHLRRLRDLARVNRYDLVYVFMYVTPFGTSVMERLVRRLAPRVVYDVEDNILIGQQMPKGFNPNAIASLLKGRGKASFLLRRADHVIASSPFLRDDCMRLYGARACTYISSSVDTSRFVPRGTPADGKVVIGWTGTFSSRIYLDQLRGVFQKLAERVDFRLRVIGNFAYELPGVDIEVVRWSAEREVEDLQALDIGVYPLPHGDWVMGKSGLKAIQYMAFGLPTVASNVGMTPQIIRHGENGLLVDTDEDWITSLERLVKEPGLRRRLGDVARQDAVARFSTAAISREYRTVLEQVAQGS